MFKKRESVQIHDITRELNGTEWWVLCSLPFREQVVEKGFGAPVPTFITEVAFFKGDRAVGHGEEVLVVSPANLTFTTGGLMSLYNARSPNPTKAPTLQNYLCRIHCWPAGGKMGERMAKARELANG